MFRHIISNRVITHIIIIILSPAFMGLSVVVTCIEAEEVGVKLAVALERFIGFVTDVMDGIDMDELEDCSWIHIIR